MHSAGPLSQDRQLISLLLNLLQQFCPSLAAVQREEEGRRIRWTARPTAVLASIACIAHSFSKSATNFKPAVGLSAQIVLESLPSVLAA